MNIKKMNRIKRNNILAYLLLAPMIIVMTVLVFYPIVVTFMYSLRQMKLTRPQDHAFVGLQNYLNVLQSEDFQYSFQNTIFLLILVLVITIVGGFFVSYILDYDSRVSGLLLALAILPWALPPIVNGIVWRFIFHPGYGFANKLLILLHLRAEPILWLSSRWLLLFVAAVVAAWRSVPFCAVVFLSAKRAIPEELHEAASIDGAGNYLVFKHITFPLMIPFIGIGITSTSVTAINIFDEIISLSGYGDLGKNLLIQDYLTTFSFLDFGKGSAQTYIIMLLSAVLGVLYIKNLYREVGY